MLAPVVFEPNSASTWQSVTAAITVEERGLYGSSPEAAYRVEMAPQDDDTANGIVRVRVGLAALRPTEFIYLEFTQDVASV